MSTSPSQAAPPPLEKLDPNFELNSLEAGQEAGTRWMDIAALTLEGQGWPTESTPFTRLPDRARPLVREPVWALSRHSAGVCVRFVSDAPSISARWTLLSDSLAMNHMPATGVSGLDLYVRDTNRGNRWYWAGVGRPSGVENEVYVLDGARPVEREYLLFLPLYNGTLSVQLGVPHGCRLEAAPAGPAQPLCFYGTSIVHGGCASRPGMAYPAILRRRLDYPALNLGFSGNGRSEPEVADLLAELDPAVYVLDPLPNMQPDEVRRFSKPFVQRLRQAHPHTPIVLVENIQYQDGWLRAARAARSTGSNGMLFQVYRELRAEGVPHLYYVGGDGLLGQDGEGTVDGTHPTDVGFMRMADAMEPLLRTLLP